MQEDPNQPNNDSEAPRTNTIDNQTPEKSNRTVIFLVVVLVLALVGLGWMWWRNKDTDKTDNKKVASTPSQEEKAACAEGLTNYEDASLGFGFCYPTEWGQATVTDDRLLTADSQGIESDTGTRWLISFSNKVAVHMGVTSTDWKTNVGRDGTCSSPEVQELPAFSPFSTEWKTQSSEGMIVEGSRGVEVSAGHYLIQESVDSLLTNGVCLVGYTIIDGKYPHVESSYTMRFSENGSAEDVQKPTKHVADPNIFISVDERTDFANLVKSIHKL